MSRIHILTEETANRIAAGEVIERPSSAVKELVENSIDAGAQKIFMELLAGGKRMVRVTDDGSGMSYDDALLCLERHATSKISKASDLYAITTFGFRGEAIPSMASVSKMEIVTRTSDSISATQVEVEGGVVRSVNEKGAPAGTRITVRNLFYNTPARLKFMKSTSTELGHVTNMVQRQALAHPHINFRLSNGEREVLNLPPAGSIFDRLVLLWGKAFADQLRYGSSEGDGITVTGYFGSPALTRSNRAHQFLFLNRRPITNRLLLKALSDAYRGIVMSDRFAVAFVFVNIDPHFVDVNIHPAKREVRFADPDKVMSELGKAFRSAFESPSRGRVQSEPAGARQREPRGKTVSGEGSLFQRITIDEDALPSVLPELEREGTEARVRPMLPLTRPTPDFSAVSPTIQFAKQIFNSYLLCVDESDLLIVDQHALHERLLYDELVAQSDRSSVATQQMLIPIAIEFSPDRAEVLAAHVDLFSQIGIEVEPFGPNTFAVTALTCAHSERRVTEIICESVDELYLGLQIKAPREILRRLMTISACKNSIKAGDSLSAKEAEMLIEGLKRLEQPPTCLHGRPLVLRLGESQIARAFGRKG